ncbi:unnamed protein product [Sphacelaria rigidula]
MFSATHARAGMIHVTGKTCGEEGCSTSPSFGVACGGKAEFCATHARIGMVHVTSKICEEEGCSTEASFGVAGGRKAMFCSTHARAGMIHVTGKTCGEEGCSTSPSFGVACGGKAEFCATHARAGMDHVKGKKCGEEGCTIQPSLGVAGDRKAELCATHARTGMVALNGKMCGMEDISNLNHPYGAGRNASCGGHHLGTFRRSCVNRSRRGSLNPTTTPPAGSGQQAGDASVDGVCLDGAASRMKVKMEMTLPPPRGCEAVATSNGLGATRSIVHGSMANRKLSDVIDRSCGRSNASARESAKRLCTVGPIESPSDTTVGDGFMSGEDGDVKFELGVSTPSSTRPAKEIASCGDLFTYVFAADIE